MTESRPLGRAVRTSLVYGIANNLLLRVGNLALGIVLARLLAPNDFGVFAVALTVQAILANLTDLGMTAFLVRERNFDRHAPTVLAIGAATGTVLALLMAALALPLATQFGSAEAVPVLRVLALTLVLTGIGSVPTALLQRRFQQGRQLLADGGSFLVSTAVALGMIASGSGVMSLAWSRVGGQLAAVALLFLLSGYRGAVRFERSVARTAWRFGLPLVGANVASWLLLNLDYVFIGRALGATALGFYVLAFNISSWPSSAIAQGLRAVALPAFAQMDDATRERRSAQVGAAMALTLAASAPIGALLVALAVPVVAVVYGDRWAASAAPLAALAAFGAVRPLFDLLATYLTARGATRSVLAVQVLWTVALVPALLLGIGRWGITGAGLAHLAVGLLVVLPAYLLALRRQGVAVRPLVASSLTPVTWALVAGAIAVGATELIDAAWATVLVGGGAAGVVYLLGVRRWVRRRLALLRTTEPLPAESVPLPDPFVTPDLDGRGVAVAVAPARGRHRAPTGRRASRRKLRV